MKSVMYYPQVEGITPTVVEPCTDAISRQAYDKGFDDGLEQGLKIGEPCEDCINREAALKCLTGDFWEDADTVLSRCYEKIKYLPSVTPAPRIGRWKPYDGSWYECSECGAIREAVGYFENFCPNCGSKMEQYGSSSGTENP